MTGALIQFPNNTQPRLAKSPTEVLTAAGLQQILQVSENTIYRELQYGFLKDIAFRVGNQWRVSAGALEKLIAGDA